MSGLTDALWVAASALRARPGRTALMAMGPLLGVAVIVGAVGMLQSTQGELRTLLRSLGDNLAVVSASDGRLPHESIERLQGLNSLLGVAGATTVPGVTATVLETPDDTRPASTLVIATDPHILGVLDVELQWGRGISQADIDAATTSAVIGAGVPMSMPVSDSALQSLFIAGQAFGIVGVLDSSPLAPEISGAILIPRTTAERRLGLGRGLSQIYLRIEEEAVKETAALLPSVVTYGEPIGVGVSIPSDLLAARAAISETLAGSIVGLGLLTMIVGGFGIANVLVISVMERRREIGVRRALGHSKGAIAVQFVAESLLVGCIGAIGGAALGFGFVGLVARAKGWTFQMEGAVVLGSVAAAILVALVAGLHPTMKASRIEPLEALRSS